MVLTICQVIYIFISFSLANHFLVFDEPLGTSTHAVSQWLSTAKFTLQRVLRLFQQDFLVLYPRNPKHIQPKLVSDSLMTDGFDNRFLPESSIERYFGNLYVIQPNTGSTFVNSVFCTNEKP